MSKPVAIGPRLQALLDAGTAYLVGTDVVLIASDGEHLRYFSVATQLSADSCDAYLTDCPTPDKW